MNVLVIAPYVPMRDRSSGELRLASLLKILAETRSVTLYTWEAWGAGVSESEKHRYVSDLERYGIELRTQGIRGVLREKRYDVVILEWYYSLDWYLEDIRTWQPRAIVVVDTVDLEFRRLTLKARLSGDPRDAMEAALAKRRELAAYRKADFLFLISDEERAILAEEEPDLRTDVLATVHHFEASLPELPEDPCLIFVGNFRHEPNVDAVQYLCHDIFPRIRESVPAAHLRIVGHAPPELVRSLAGGAIEVTGFVPDLTPYLATSRVAVAPLRYGAGVKGKVGEAVAFGLPVVTTSVGAQGLHLVAGRDLLVADTADAFAESVTLLLRDRSFCEVLRSHARLQLKQHCSEEAIRHRLYAILEQLTCMHRPLARSPLHRRWKRKCRDWLQRNLLWRLQGESRRSA